MCPVNAVSNALQIHLYSPPVPCGNFVKMCEELVCNYSHLSLPPLFP